MRNQFYGSPKTSQEVEEDLDFIGTIPKQQINETAFNFIRFQGQDLASFLGFKNLFSGYSRATLEYTYTEDKFFKLSYIPDSIIVELLNIDLKS